MILFFFLLCLIVSPAWAQPSITSHVEYGSGVNTNHSTPSITSTGSNRGLVACITSDDAGENNVTSVTFNGQSFSLVRAAGESDVGSNFYASVWYLVNPGAVSDNVDYVHQDSVRSAATIIAIQNAAQSQPTLSNEATGNSPISAGLTSTVNNTLMMTCAMSDLVTHTHSHGAGQTEESEVIISAAGHMQSTSYELKATAGAETLSTQTNTGTPAMQYVVFGIEPAGAPPPSGHRRQGAQQFR